MYKKWAIALKQHIEKTHSEDKIYDKVINSIFNKSEQKNDQMQGEEGEVII